MSNTTTTITSRHRNLTSTSELSRADRFRFGVVRTVAVGIVAAGAVVVVGGPLADSASAGPVALPTPTPIHPPQTTTTVKRRPPFSTIPPIVVADSGTPSTTVPPVPTTVPPTTAAPTTAAPTTAAPTPKPPTTKKPKAAAPAASASTSGDPTNEPAASPDVAPLGSPVVAPIDDQLVADGGVPITLGAADSTPVVALVGGSLVGAVVLVAAGLAYDRRRKAHG